MTRPVPPRVVPPLTLAAAQPSVALDDLDGAVAAHAAAVAQADARLVVFPELSLTGYDLGAGVVAPDDPRLLPLVAACRTAGATALVGAPVAGEAGDTIATLAVDAAGVRVAYEKVWVGAEEAVRFVGGPGPVVLELEGLRVGLGTCRDTGVAAHVEAMAALDLDVYAAGLVHAPDELAEQDARGGRIARATGAWVVLASFAGPTGSGYERTAGHSTIWDAGGAVVARADAAPGRVVRAERPGTPSP